MIKKSEYATKYVFREQGVTASMKSLFGRSSRHIKNLIIEFPPNSSKRSRKRYIPNHPISFSKRSSPPRGLEKFRGGER